MSITSVQAAGSHPRPHCLSGEIPLNDIRKAMAEKSSLVGNIQREQHLVEAVYVETVTFAQASWM